MNNRHSVVLGTSPIVLLHALNLARQGEFLTVVDRALDPGGAWVAPPALGFESFECAVHLLENRPRFYEVLAELGVEMALDEHCRTLVRGRALSMTLARPMFHTLVALNALRHGKVDQFRRIGTSAVRSLTLMRAPFYYPVDGGRAITEALLKALDGYGIVRRMGLEIDSISIETSGGVICKTREGPIACDRILVASRAHAPIEIDGIAFTPKLEHGEISSLLMRGIETNRFRLGYVEIIGDRLLKRLREVSAFCQPAIAPGEFALCVQLRSEGLLAYKAEGLSSIIRQLKDLGLLSRTSSILHSALHQVEYDTIPDVELYELARKANGRLIPVFSTDFADGFLTRTHDGV